MNEFMKTPCANCPFRTDVKPFLHPKRGEELAYHAQNPYNSFTCHKTTVADPDSDEGEMMLTNKSKECAGFINLQINEGMRVPENFNPETELVYANSFIMAESYKKPIK